MFVQDFFWDYLPREAFHNYWLNKKWDYKQNMTVSSLTAANAYKNQLNLQSWMGDAEIGDEAGKSSFSDMVKQGLQSAIDTQYKVEATKMDSLTGKVDLTDLVAAVNNAELTMNTVVAIRDKVISAYQSIIAMPM